MRNLTSAGHDSQTPSSTTASNAQAKSEASGNDYDSDDELNTSVLYNKRKKITTTGFCNKSQSQVDAVALSALSVS